MSPVPDSNAARRATRRRRIARRRLAAALLVLAVVAVVAALVLRACSGEETGTARGDGRAGLAGPLTPRAVPLPPLDGDGVKVGTWLGDPTRRFYGLGPAPDSLRVLWRTEIGSGWTSGKRADDPPSVWVGTGWTGQALLVRDQGRLDVLVGGYDHGLHRIDARTGRLVWEYRFDDIVKSTPTIVPNPAPTGADDRYLVVAGSRRGYPLKLGDPSIAPFRAVTFGSGREVWRLPVPRTACYSRDCDGTALFQDGRVYIGTESGWFYALDPFSTTAWGEWRRPRVLGERLLLGDARDRRTHKDNLVLEASPALLGGHLFVASGNGHVYALRRNDLSVAWDLRVGSDLDGTTVPTRRGNLLVPVEKEYIKGHGGLLCVDPTKPPASAAVWYLPTGDRRLGDWKGGVIGSPAVNDAYDPEGRRPALAAVVALDGDLYVLSQTELAARAVKGPDGVTDLPSPRVVARLPVGGGISTPIIVGDAIVAGGYDRSVHVYRITYRAASADTRDALPSPDGRWWTVSVQETASYATGGAIESTPVLWDGRIYVGSRDGWFYCLGE